MQPMGSKTWYMLKMNLNILKVFQIRICLLQILRVSLSFLLQVFGYKAHYCDYEIKEQLCIG